jgi:glycosyltransferase involved in cell wall biosynthesis
MLKNCAKIIFLSEWIKDKFFLNLNFKNSDKTSVIYPAIKSDLKKEKKRNKEILFVGKLNSSKGYDLFL